MTPNGGAAATLPRSAVTLGGAACADAEGTSQVKRRTVAKRRTRRNACESLAGRVKSKQPPWRRSRSARGHLIKNPGFRYNRDRCRSHHIAPLAQLDRASGYEPEGREFESLRAHHSYQTVPISHPLLQARNRWEAPAIWGPSAGGPRVLRGDLFLRDSPSQT